MRWTALRRWKCLHLIRHGFAVPPSPHRRRQWIAHPKAPLPGELSAKLTERLSQICIEKPKPQIQFAVWKGRNGLRGKEAPRTAGTRSVEAGSDAPPAAPSFPSCRKRWGEKRGAGMRLVLSASEFRQGPVFQASFHSEVTLRVSAARRLIRGAKFAASCHRTFAVNRRCRPDLLVCTFLRGGFFARRG